MLHSSAFPSANSTALGRTILVLWFILLRDIFLDRPGTQEAIVTVGEEPASPGRERQGANVIEPVVVRTMAWIGVEESTVRGTPQPDLPGSSAGGEQIPVRRESERGYVDVTIQFVHAGPLVSIPQFEAVSTHGDEASVGREGNRLHLTRPWPKDCEELSGTNVPELYVPRHHLHRENPSIGPPIEHADGAGGDVAILDGLEEPALAHPPHLDGLAG